LPEDLRVFCIIPCANRFDAKCSTSHREYSYFLPSFLLSKISDLNLESPSKPIEADQRIEQVDKEEQQEHRL
jgi:tRNA U38,U39,U40 pseudouridine synthase TruA